MFYFRIEAFSSCKEADLCVSIKSRSRGSYCHDNCYPEFAAYVFLTEIQIIEAESVVQTIDKEYGQRNSKGCWHSMHILCIYIAQVRGFARGKAKCNIQAHNAQVWYPMSDLLHLRNDILIGHAYIARGNNKNLYAYVQKHELCSYISHTY